MAERRWWVRAGIVLVVGVIACVWLVTEPARRASGAPAAEAGGGPHMVRAANALLDSLNSKQRAAATFALAGAEHEDWHFIPRSRKGVSFATMTPFQRERLRSLLRVGLGDAGLQKAEQVRALETVLRRIEGEGRRFPRDSELYSLSFFGEPSQSARWAWRFEGHHLSINFELAGDRIVSATPAFFGANPAVVRDGPEKGLQVLRGVEETARAFVEALTADQLRRCRGEEVPGEVPATSKSRYDGPLPAGVAGADLDDAQRAKLGALIEAYLSKLAPDLRDRMRARLAADGGLGAVRVAWKGELESGKPHSYLVHSPTFVINYSNVQNGANHVHSSLRLRDGDFGKSLRGQKSASAPTRL